MGSDGRFTNTSWPETREWREYTLLLGDGAEPASGLVPVTVCRGVRKRYSPPFLASLASSYTRAPVDAFDSCGKPRPRRIASANLCSDQGSRNLPSGVRPHGP